MKFVKNINISPVNAEVSTFKKTIKSDEAISVGVVSRKNAINALKCEWLALEVESPNTVLFQSWAWCKHFVEYSHDVDDFEPRIITLRQHGKLVGLLPLKVARLRGMRLLTGLSEPYQQYTEMLAADALKFDDMRRQFLQALRGLKVDYWHFGQVCEGGDLAKLLKGIAKPSGERDASPFVQISNWENFETYYKSIKSRTRKNMRNAVNRLERGDALSHEHAQDGELFAGVIDNTFAGRKAWLERLGITSRAFNDERFAAFVSSFKTVTDTGVEMLAMRLKHGDKPIAEQWGFIYYGRYYAFMASWDEDYVEFSPGKLHLGRVIETCYEKNLQAVDFMIPDVDYKRTWAKDAVPVCDYVRAESTLGFLYTRGWVDILRPLAKKVVYGMSPKFRQVLMGIVIGLSPKS